MPNWFQLFECTLKQGKCISSPKLNIKSKATTRFASSWEPGEVPYQPKHQRGCHVLAKTMTRDHNNKKPHDLEDLKSIISKNCTGLSAPCSSFHGIESSTVRKRRHWRKKQRVHCVQQMHSFPSRRKRRSPVANRQPPRTCNYSPTAASLLQTLQETKIQGTDVQQMKNWNKHLSGDLISFTCHMYGSKEDGMTACCGLWSPGDGIGKKNPSGARSTESQKEENKWW